MFFSKKCPNPNCGKKVSSDQLFCGYCGTDLENARSAEINHNTWQPRTDEFAARIKIADLSGFFRGKELIVATGCQAYIFNQGKTTGIVKAGKYTLEGLLSKINRLGSESGVEAVVCREAPLVLDFDFCELLSKDYLPLNFSTTLGIQITDPELFVGNYMSAQHNVVTTGDIRKLLGPMVRQIVAEYLRTLGINEITDTASLRRNMNRKLEEGMRNALMRYGLSIVEVQSLAVSQTEYDENNQMVAQAWLDKDRREKEMLAQQALDQLRRSADFHEIEQQRHRLQIIKLRRELAHSDKENDYTEQLRSIDLYDRISKAETREEAIRLNTAGELDKLQHQAAYEQDLRNEEKAQWAHVQALAKAERDKLLRITAEKNRYEFQRIVGEHEFKEKMAQRQAEIELAKLNDDEHSRKLLVTLEREQAQLEFEWKKRRDTLDSSLEESRKQFEHDLWKKREQDKVDHEDFQRWMAQEREKDAQRQSKRQAQLDTLARITEINMHADKVESELRRADKEQTHSHKIEEMKVLGELGPEALIHLSSKEQGEIIAGLRRTEIMQGMSEAQILALAAENSPHVAAALTERFKQSTDTMSPREAALYERLIAAASAEADRIKDMAMSHSEALLRSQEINARIEIARATAAAPQPTPAAPAAKICRHCQYANTPDYRVCGQCGAIL